MNYLSNSIGIQLVPIRSNCGILEDNFWDQNWETWVRQNFSFIFLVISVRYEGKTNVIFWYWRDSKNTNANIQCYILTVQNNCPQVVIENNIPSNAIMSFNKQFQTNKRKIQITYILIPSKIFLQDVLVVTKIESMSVPYN